MMEEAGLRPAGEPRATGGSSQPQDGHEWVTLRTAPDQLTAELWRELLLSEGVPATLAPADAVSFLGVSPAPCRLLVPAHWREQAELALSGEAWSLRTEER